MARYTVLIADDDAGLRRLLSATLANPDFALLLAADGLEALRLAREHLPDVVVLDVVMPGLNGFDVCEALKADPQTSHARVILLTALQGPQERARGQQAGADAFLTKPFSPVELLDKLYQLLPQ